MPNRKTPALTKYRPKTVASDTPRRRHCCPQQLRAGEAADDSDKAGIGGVEWHSRPAQLPPKQPQAHQRGESPPLSR